MTDRSLSERQLEQAPTGVGQRSFADDIIDELVPDELDWRTVVTSYPKASVAILAVAGFWLGRSRGRSILRGVTGLVADTVNESINEFFGRDVV